MKKNQIICNHSFRERFSCIGGECPLTCCNPKVWPIRFSEDDMERYRNLSEPIRSKILNCIDMENKVLMSKGEVCGTKGPQGDYCALLTEDGWCEMVLECGEEVLSTVCRYHPRDTMIINDHIDQWVDISCPVVAGYLFDEVPIENAYYDYSGYHPNTEYVDEDAFNVIYSARDFFMELFLKKTGNNAGKYFIYFDVLSELIKLKEKGEFIPAKAQAVLSKYENDEVYLATMRGCEDIVKDTGRRGTMAMLGIESCIDVLQKLPEYLPDMLCDLDKHLKEWQKGVSIAEDLAEFCEYRDRKWPEFIGRLMSTRTFVGFVKNSIDDFGKVQKMEYFLNFIEEIAAMSYWKAHGKEITADEYVIIFSMLERVYLHTTSHKKQLTECVNNFEKSMNFALFSPPAY